MATLITYETSGGAKGRCDAKCYNANSARCVCICGGANHGKTLEVALVQTRIHFGWWLEQYKRAHPGEEVRAKPFAVQSELFGGA